MYIRVVICIFVTFQILSVLSVQNYIVMNQSIQQHSASYSTEWSLIKGRGFTLTFLALGSTIANFSIGHKLGLQMFPEYRIIGLGVALAFAMLLYFCVDWVLKVILTELSRAGQEGATVQDIYGQIITIKPTDTTFLWRIAAVALAITTVISLTSNFMVADQLSGESPYKQYQVQLFTSLTRNDEASSKALEALQAVGVDTTLTNKRERMIYTAVHSTKNRSWIRDYEQAKGNMEAWFWTCTQCPTEYRQYRTRILAAMNQADDLATQSKQSSVVMTQGIAQTLQGVTDTTTLSKLETVSALLNDEKEGKEWLINAILLAMTLGGAVLSVILTKLLKKHRETNGQLVNDNPAAGMMRIANLFNASSSMEVQQVIQHQSIVPETTTELVQEKEGVQAQKEVKRICQLEACHEDLDALGLRSDARYCCKEHRYKANAAKRKRENIFTLRPNRLNLQNV